MPNITSRFTGRSLDTLTSRLGLRSAYRLKFGDVEIFPTPKIKKVRSEPANQTGPSEFVAESVTKWHVSIPIDTLNSLFPDESTWRDAISSGRLWSVTMPNNAEWLPATTEGEPLDGERGRVVVTLAAIGWRD